MKHFIIHRRGTFHSEAPLGTHDWCRDVQHTKFDYEVSVVCGDKGQSVVIYHEDIAAKIGERAPTGTCEQMATQICKAIEELFRERKLAYNVVYVKVLPQLPKKSDVPVAFMEYVSYKTPKDVPLLALIR